MSFAERWLYIVGIGEDAWEGLNAEARHAVQSADLLYGGARHLDLIPSSASSATRIAWPSPMAAAVQRILEQDRGRRQITVLASGDPMLYGAGVTLARDLSPAEFRVIPQVSALSLVCARLGWPVAETHVVSLVNRPIEQLHRYLYSGERIIVFSESGRSPSEVASFLMHAGCGMSAMHVFENLGGPRERTSTGLAASWPGEPASNLNMIAILCVADAGITPLPLTPGLPDDAFATDGQLTKRETRAVTLARLAPTPGKLLWDVGAGTGTIGIEWMRAHPSCTCIAFEQRPDRAARIHLNAARLGVPGLRVIEATAPDCFTGLPGPDAIFLGGSVASENLFEASWAALAPGGRLVANAVTIESEARLIARHATYGGDLMRMTVSRADRVGGSYGWRPMMPITQWTVTKP